MSAGCSRACPAHRPRSPFRPPDATPAQHHCACTTSSARLPPTQQHCRPPACPRPPRLTLPERLRWLA
jgi:hypothetical protein